MYQGIETVSEEIDSAFQELTTTQDADYNFVGCHKGMAAKSEKEAREREEPTNRREEASYKQEEEAKEREEAAYKRDEEAREREEALRKELDTLRKSNNRF